MTERKTFANDFKRFFGRGLGVLLPTGLTLWILSQLFMFLMNNVGQPINRGVRLAVIEITPRILPDEKLPGWFRVSDREIAEARAASRENLALFTLLAVSDREVADARLAREIRRIPEMSDERVRSLLRRNKFRDHWNAHWYLEATGLVVAIVLVYFAGVFLGGFLGRRVYAKMENWLSRVPGFKQVYPHVKRVVEMVLGERPIAFNRVIIVEYPRKGIWTVGLVTGESMSSIRDAAASARTANTIPPCPATSPSCEPSTSAAAEPAASRWPARSRPRAFETSPRSAPAAT